MNTTQQQQQKMLAQHKKETEMMHTKDANATVIE